MEPPPPPVTVATPVIQCVTSYHEFTVTTVVIDHAEVRSRVAGVLESIDFTPGTFVRLFCRVFQVGCIASLP